MAHIFDNIDKLLIPAPQKILLAADHAVVCDGLVNLRGLSQSASHVETWTGCHGKCPRFLKLSAFTPGTDRTNCTTALERNRLMLADTRRVIPFTGQFVDSVPDVPHA